MSHGFILIDTNNLGFAAQYSTPLKVGDQPTQAIYGVLRGVRHVVATYPQLTPICLWDGASWRSEAFPEYKANREKEPVSAHEIAQAKGRAEYKGQRKFIVRGLRHLGVRQMFADNLEADDLVGILVRRYAATKKIVMVSGDTDWIQLVRPNVGWIDPVASRDKRITIKNLPEKLGYMKTQKVKQEDGTTIEQDQEWRPVKSPEAWLEIKALMGDSTDNIPGVGGIALKGAVELLLAFGTVSNFLNLSIDKTAMPKLPKKFEDFALSPDKQAVFRRNMMLMDLSSDLIPKPVNMRVVHDPQHAAFRSFCGDFLFSSILSDFEGWVAPFVSSEANPTRTAL